MTKDKHRPETPLDVEVLVREHVPGINLEKHLEFTEDDQNLIVKITRYLPQGWNEIMDLVVLWDGGYDKPNRRWVIPKKPGPSQTPEAASEEIVEGVIERVETLAGKDWLHIYVENITKPLAIKPDLATPGLKPGNRIRAEVSIGESWLFIRRFDIPKEVERARAPKPEGPQPYTRLGYYPDFPIDKILSSKFSFRLNIGEGIQDLMAEIHAAGRIIEPLICRPHRKLTYVELGPGERRLLAARNLGLKTVPIIVANFTDEEFDRVRVLENIARKDLTDHEIGRILEYLLKKYPNKYPSQKALAEEFQKSEGWISHHLKILELQKVVPGQLLDQMTEHHAREIFAAPEEKREEIIDYIKTTGEIPSVREIRKFVAPSPKETAEIGKEVQTEELPEESIEQPAAGIRTPEAAVEARRAEAPSPAGFEPTPAEKISTAVEIPSEVATSEPPRDIAYDKAMKYYHSDLVATVWEKVTIESRRMGFLKMVAKVLWDWAVEKGFAENILEDAKERFQSAEVRHI